MAKIISFINEKGGIGKSSILFNSAWELSKKKKILMIDLDGQAANLTYYCGVQKNDELKTVFNILVNGTDIKETVINVKENLDLVPAKSEVSTLPENSSPGKLMKQLGEVYNDYDYIFIDVSPTPNKSHFLALCVCDYAIIPMLPDASSLKGLDGITESITETKFMNPRLKVLGIVFNKNENRTNLSKEVKTKTEILSKALDCTPFSATIRQSVKSGENIAKHVGITDYVPNEAIANDYLNFIKEMEERING